MIRTVRNLLLGLVICWIVSLAIGYPAIEFRAYLTVKGRSMFDIQVGEDGGSSTAPTSYRPRKWERDI